MTPTAGPTERLGVAWLVDRLVERTGLDFSGSHHDRMVETLRRMYHESGAASPAAYVDLLDDDEQEYETLLDRLTVGETYFFREPAHFDLLRRSIAPGCTENGGRLRLWSAGCASGEEAYSAAITLAGAGLRSEIIGTDLSERALDRARAAVYGRWSLRRCDDEQRGALFRHVGGRFRLEDRYRDGVRWGRRGLLDGPPAGAFDVVMCRNVLIYLTPEAVAAASATLHDALAPEGWLLMGASDPPLEHPGLRRVFGTHGVAYRRSDRPVAALWSSRAAPAGPVAGRTPRPARASRPSAPEPSSAPATPAKSRADRLASIRALCDRGRVEDARHAVDGAIADDPEDTELRYFGATVHLEAGRPRDAARHAGAALYLEPEMIVAHLLLARCEEAAGHTAAAQRSFRNAQGLLAALPPDAEVPFADGERVAALIAVVESSLGGAQGTRP